MLKEFVFIIVLAAIASSYGILAEEEYPAVAESAGLHIKRSRRKLPTSKKLVQY